MIIASVEISTILSGGLLVAIAALITTVLNNRAQSKKTAAGANREEAEADARRVETADQVVQLVRQELEAAAGGIVRLRAELAAADLATQDCRDRCAVLQREVDRLTENVRALEARLG